MYGFMFFSVFFRVYVQPPGRNVKKHLFSDTDTDNMTDISWIKSANRRPKPKVADYTRQPVKPSHPPVNTKCKSFAQPCYSYLFLAEVLNHTKLLDNGEEFLI